MPCRSRQDEPSRRVARLWLGGVMLAICLLVTTQASAVTTPSETREKATLLLRLAQFVEWPSAATARPNFTVCVVGDPLLGIALANSMAGRPLYGRPVSILLPRGGEAARQCDVVFFGLGAGRSVPGFLDMLKGDNVLTVSDTPGFTAAGGMLEVHISGDRAQVVANPGAAELAHLKLSSHLLALARLVHTEGRG